jgi:sugar lactone lactonase YvrE
MTRWLFAVLVPVALAPAATAQDMPLSQILLDGEGWKKAGGSAEKPPPPLPEELAGTRDGDGRRATALHATADGGTLYAGYADGRAVWAFRVGADRKPAAGAPYCPLRLKRGESGTKVTSIAIDADGRVYAATPLGIQVFDPTGRLCGVMTAPAGEVAHLGFEGDRLVAWVGETMYTRKLNTAGAR